MKRRALITAVLLLCLAGCRTEEGPETWLWSQQQADGGWHSTTYGLLRSGQSLTPFILLTLLESRQLAVTAKVDSALAFVAANTAADGSLGRMDESSQDYPNYATSLAIRAIVKAGRPGWQQQIAPMLRYLRSQQFAEENGWKSDHMAYGAWGMGGERLHPPQVGHVDLSMTRHVLQAFRDAGVPADDAAFQKAQVYLKRLQNGDGGFFFSTTEEDTNKAGSAREGEFRSYGTATADGVLALRATGIPASDARVRTAWSWLTKNQTDPGRIAGFTGAAYDRWHHGLAFYYAAVLAEAAQSIREKAPYWRLPAPDAKGRFVNPENLVKEDDPLISTTLAVQARHP